MPRSHVVLTWLTMLVSTVTAIGCTTSGEIDTDFPVTMVPSATVVAVTKESTATIEITNTSLPTPTISFPEEQDGHIPLNQILFNGFNDECAVPCWYGLKIGESDQEDVQSLFDNVFGFNGTIDFWAPHDGVAVNFRMFLNPIEGMLGTGYQWADRDTEDNIGIGAFVDEQTKTLQGIVIIWGGRTSGFADVTPSDLFERLGTPSSILVDATPREALFIFDVGIAFHFFVFPDKELCFGEDKFDEVFEIGTLVITSSLENRLNNLSALETHYFGRFITNDNLRPVEEVTNMTPEMITQSVLNGEDNCLNSQTE
jgi:hypothetical protein